MKFAFILSTISTLALSSIGFASPNVPNCWDTPDVVSKEYLVGIERSQLGSRAALDLLDKLSHTKYLGPLSYPLFMGDFISVHLKAANHNSMGSVRLSDADFRQAVESELAELQLNYQFSIECNGIMHHMTSTLSNNN